jgi:hypothetical protein
MQADFDFINLINEIEDELMAEAKVKKERKPRAKKQADTNVGSLIEALKFLSLAQSKAGTDSQTHCQIENHWGIVNNGIISMGVPVEEDLTVCPHTHMFLASLQECKGAVQMTQTASTSLEVKSDSFQAKIDCVESISDYELTCLNIVDPSIAPITDAVIDAFKCVGKLSTKNSENYVFGSVLLQSGSAVATDGSAILEYWHGVNLPPNLLIPKEAIEIIIKAKKSLKSFGFSDSSMTFYFEDDSWLKTDLVNEPYINYQQLLNVQANAVELPPEFFIGVKSLSPIAQDKIINFDETGFYTNNNARFELLGLPKDIAFSIEYLLDLQEYMVSADFNVEDQQCLFFGNNVRGILKAIEL